MEYLITLRVTSGNSFRNFLNAPKNRNSNEFWWETGTEAGRKARIDAFNKLIDFYGHTETV